MGLVCYISGCNCGKPKHNRQTEDDVYPKATNPDAKLNLSDWDNLNNEVARLTQQVGDLTELVETLEAGFGIEYKVLRDDQNKLMDTLEAQLGTIRDLHDTVATQTRMIDRLKMRVTDLEYQSSKPDVKTYIRLEAEENRRIHERTRLLSAIMRHKDMEGEGWSFSGLSRELIDQGWRLAADDD